MATTAQTFYLDIIDDDQTGGTVIKKIAQVAPSANATTTMTWTTATVETRTHIPLAGTTTNSDTSTVNAWDFNNGGADGLGSTASGERWIKPGVWNFSMSYTLNAPALLQTIACTVTAKVYRVATGGGTRTLLFSATSANFAASATITWSSASQPEYVLGAGEVIQVGFTASSAATTAAVGAITNTVLTVNLGASSFFSVPSPGVRTLSRGDYSMTGVGALAFIPSKVLGTAYASSGSGALTVAGGSIFSGIYSMTGVGTLAANGSSVAGSVYSMAGSGALTGKMSIIQSAKYTMDSGGTGGTTIINKIFAILD